MSTSPQIYPTFRYRDPARMIDWLGKAFGFTVRVRHEDNIGTIQHAEMSLGASIVMLGGVRDDDYGRIVGEPGNNGGKSTYVAVEDADAVHASAVAAGAKILQPLVDRDYGSREFICADPEGNVWSFGTYWPKASDPS